MKKPRLSWRKEPYERGMAGTARRSPYGYDLWLGEEHLVSVRTYCGDDYWYWYGFDGENTLNRPSGQERVFSTEHEAKRDAMESAREYLRVRGQANA